MAPLLMAGFRGRLRCRVAGKRRRAEGDDGLRWTPEEHRWMRAALARLDRYQNDVEPAVKAGRIRRVRAETLDRAYFAEEPGPTYTERE